MQNPLYVSSIFAIELGQVNTKAVPSPSKFLVLTNKFASKWELLKQVILGGFSGKVGTIIGSNQSNSYF